MDNISFLKIIFKENFKTSHVTAFMDDPTNIRSDRRGICWGGMHAGEGVLSIGNQYYCVSQFDLFEGRPVRRKAQFKAMYVVVADDVREKLLIELVEKLPLPTYKLLTSQNSEQWGWVLSEPITDRSIAENLLDGLVERGLAPDGKDPGMKGVTRYVRLPDGYNSKSNRLIDGKPFKCQILQFEPERLVRYQDIAASFEIDVHVTRRDCRIDGASNIETHPIFEHLAIKNTISPGRVDITCPWVDEHSNGQDDGTVVFTNTDGSIGFKCHHGHCENRTGRDLLRHIEEAHPGWKSKFDSWKVSRSLGSSGELILGSPPTMSDNSKDETLFDKLMQSPIEAHPESTYKIMQSAEQLDHAEQLEVHNRICLLRGWTKRDLNKILEEQRRIWNKDLHNSVLSSELRVENGERIPKNFFPDLGTSGKVLSSLANLEFLLNCYQIKVCYNQISKMLSIKAPWIKDRDDGKNSQGLEQVLSLASLNNMAREPILNQVIDIGYDNPVNPVLVCLESVSPALGAIRWLGQHIEVDKDHEFIRDRVFRLFMIMACAASDYAKRTPREDAVPKFDSVLVLSGEQGKEKTKFFKAMLPPLTREYFKDGVLLDTSDKDSVLKSVRHWVNELGELDATFKKTDIARLKAFLSESNDIIRPPYARVAEDFQRRSVFVASVNEHDFLKDHTGNRRYWPLRVVNMLIPSDDRLIEGAWGEAWQAYLSGEAWWTDTSFEEMLLNHRMSFEIPVIDNPTDISGLIAKGEGIFANDIVTVSEIYAAINSSNFITREKPISRMIIGKIMSQQRLGDQFKDWRGGRYWIIRNVDKYKSLSNSEKKKCYDAQAIIVPSSPTIMKD